MGRREECGVGEDCASLLQCRWSASGRKQVRTHWDAHALGADVAEAQDALAVRDDHDLDIVARPVCDELCHRTLHSSKADDVS